ncbi:MAG: LpxA family transferase [Burkholderiaceae bacterium]
MRDINLSIQNYIADVGSSPLAKWSSSRPWDITSQSEDVVRQILLGLPVREFNISNEIAVHRSCSIESGAVLKGPLVLGPESFVAAGAYLRGGCWIGERCIFGPGSELKSSFVFSGTKLAHFNFVGDSVLGSGVNLEAGSIICNYRNERSDKEIVVRINGALSRTGCQKFGALVGDQSRIGANAVVAPGALLLPGAVVRRSSLRDDEASDSESDG